MAGKEGGGARFLGSLREALAAASREDTAKPVRAVTPDQSSPLADPQHGPEAGGSMSDETTQPHQPAKSPSAAEAAREARGGTPNVPPVPAGGERHVEFDQPPTTRVVREAAQQPAPSIDEAPKTQMLRGKQQVQRGAFNQDPVVAWLVVVGGPGIGSYRPIFEGNNTLGRSSSQRIPIDFGDDAISAEEQCFIRYDSAGRTFLFVPNLAKANVVSVNETRPTGAVALNAMDVITLGRTQLVFVPFCGPEFDWSDIEQAR
ncbi:MAG: hypothetical protein RLZ98_317 [Pseudomonadota bacterium]|jgi:hypothetical protein